MKLKPIPDDRPQVTPYLVVPGVAKLIEFLRIVLGAEEVHRTAMPDGRIAHAEVRIGSGNIMMGEPYGEMKPMPASVFVYVNDTDAAYRRALEAGATSLMEPADQFHGDRYGGVEDASGNRWWFATHIEDVSPEEMKRREAAFIAERSAR